MATKNNPGSFDCYDNAAPDEPMFVLLGRDPCAPLVIAFWAHMRVAMARNKPFDRQLEEAEEVAHAMAAWHIASGKGDAHPEAFEAFESLVPEIPVYDK
jgi:hypothetical protein